MDTYTFYRESRIGKALKKALIEKIRTNHISQFQASQIMKKFDAAIPIVFDKHVTQNLSFKGRVNYYKHYMGVCTFSTYNFQMTYSNEVIVADDVKIVTCNSNESGNERNPKRKRENDDKKAKGRKKKKKN